MANRFSIEAVFKAIDKVTAPVSRMQNRVLKFTRKMQRGFHKLNRSVGKLASGIKRMARIGVVAFVGVGFALTSLLSAGADFEQAITNVGAVTLQTRKQIEPLEKLALKLGRTTKFTATQSASAMEIMARAGFKVNEILTATPAVLSAAAASGLEIAEVANVVSNALKGMGLETSEAAKVADILALASSKTNSTIGSLGESLKNVASTARQLSIPIEEVVASIALLQDVGLDASVAGSAFNVMLTKMAKPTPKIAKQMKKFGISFKDAKGDMLPLQKVLEQLSIASKKAGGNFDRVAFLADLVGLRGQKAAANLADLFEKGKISNLVKELKNAKGAADKMANIRMDTTEGSLLLLASAVDAVNVRIFDLQSGPLRKTIDKMTEWVGVNENLIATKVGGFLLNLITNLGNIWKWIKRIGIALAVFFVFTAALKSLVLVMTAVNLVMALNPIGLIVIGVIALIAAFTALVVWIDDISAGFDKLPLAIQLILAPIGLLIKAIKFIKENFSVITNVASKIGSFLGFGGDEDQRQQSVGGSDVISPQDRIAQSIEEKRTTSTAEIRLTAGDGTKAELVSGKLGAGLNLQPSGAM